MSIIFTLYIHDNQGYVTENLVSLSDQVAGLEIFNKSYRGKNKNINAFVINIVAASVFSLVLFIVNTIMDNENVEITLNINGKNLTISSTSSNLDKDSLVQLIDGFITDNNIDKK